MQNLILKEQNMKKVLKQVIHFFLEVRRQFQGEKNTNDTLFLDLQLLLMLIKNDGKK